MNNRHAVHHLELAIQNLQRSNGHRAEVDPILAKFQEAFDELRALDPGEADSPGRREAAAVAAEAPPAPEVAPEPAKDTVASSFEEAAEIAKERFSAGAS